MYRYVNIRINTYNYKCIFQPEELINKLGESEVSNGKAS